jgi:hypothetical protein
VNLSTVNVRPIAEAGPDQALTTIGAIVQLDGTSSYDPDGDNISYQWSMPTKPAMSNAVLSDTTSARPTFEVDVNGTYVLELVVRDPWTVSLSDTVTVSFDNLVPVANAGVNQVVSVGYTVALDGSRSSDANGDPLTYKWGLTTKPSGSGAILTDGLSASPHFVADRPGTYVCSLVVNDGIVDSPPSNVTVTATYSAHQATALLTQAIDAINSLPSSAFKNPNMKNALTNKISAAIQSVDARAYADAFSKLRYDVLAKMDGCSVAGSIDANDWIASCEAQQSVSSVILSAVNVLGNLN